ncbi:hypothetical protein WJ97_14065 [Burkholderia ubonensis]|uniref:hypothetical protein n=1 Tax=Burkholderia ubonensis TaxID=101571 RepID=UPI000753E7EF|nr:hypothetical protein [Burkholderia ubonensis]KVP96942.1 hypothetical protein WJ97_14065 [Burkholderia ubonensis]
MKLSLPNISQAENAAGGESAAPVSSQLFGAEGSFDRDANPGEKLSRGMKPYTYVLVREDIPLEQQIVQACHAALEAGFAFDAPPVTSSLIVCTVPNREALLAARERLDRYGIRSEMFFEPSWGMGYSALTTEPLIERKKRFAMNIYPLFRAAGATAGQED